MTAKTRPQPAPAASASPPPEIPPANVLLNEAGQQWRTILVRAPQGLVPDDLKDGRIWRRVQCVPQRALVKLDRLFVLAADESWGADAIVTHASNTEARLVVLKVFSLAVAGQGLYTDSEHEVHFDGGNFVVRRVADKIIAVPGSFTTEQMAIDGLHTAYPRKA
jgi:hypothetical protein